jgi:hypothetical protein
MQSLGSLIWRLAATGVGGGCVDAHPPPAKPAGREVPKGGASRQGSPSDHNLTPDARPPLSPHFAGHNQVRYDRVDP